MKKLSLNILREYLMVFTVNMSLVTTGMTLGWPSPMLLKLNDPSQSHLSRPITTEEGSWLVSLGFMMGVICNVPAGYLIDWIGRKCTLLVVTVPKLVGCFLLMFGEEVWVLILGRTLILTGDCALFIVVPVYSSELARKELRGTLGTFLQLLCSIGLLITFTVGPFVTYMTFNIILACMIVATGLPIFGLLDSPYYMYSKGRIAEATQTLIYLRGSEAEAKEEIEEYVESKNSKIEKLTLLRTKLFWKSLALASVVSGGSQIIGYNAVSYYMQPILESSKTNLRSEFGSVIVGLIQLFGSLCTPVTADRYGRRPVIVVSLLAILIGMIGLGAFFQLKEIPGYEVKGLLNYLPTASLVIITYGYSAGIGSIAWVLAAELFEGPSRAFGVSIVLTLTKFILFILTKYFPLLTLSLGAGNTYWMFSVNCAVILILIFIFVPETKGKSFSDIQKVLINRTFNFKHENGDIKKNDNA